MTADYEDTPPDPGPTIAALASLGYSTVSAVADIVDNSISNGSTHVEINRHWDGTDSWCSIKDDGSGMSEGTLRDAMRIGSKDALGERSATDHGRFGFGLKTASFSQCAELTVSTRVDEGGRAAIRSWDLDHVRATKEWSLRTSAGSEAAEILRLEDDGSRGTIVVWRRLYETEFLPDQSAESRRRQFLGQTATLEHELSMIYGRVLGPDLHLGLNGTRIVPWDPFLSEEEATQSLPEERLMLRGETIRVRPFVLPHSSKLTAETARRAAGPHGWNSQQGFYVYRQGRLISAGSWLGLGLQSDDAHNLARVEVDVPSSLDRDWNLSVTKSSIKIPRALKSDFRRIAQATRRRAAAVARARTSKLASPRANPVVPMWRREIVHGTDRLRINRAHPLIADLVRAANSRAQVDNVLTLLESTVPLNNIRPSQSAAQQPDEALRTPTPIVLTLATQLYEKYLADGKTRVEAMEIVQQTQPFNEYAGLAESIQGEPTA